ncbi:unnamed protein product [Rotaria socialis]|uniref:Trans-1,2-dihydrobenzene-1,2-diol dehydrogenase n=1 Tax=Rotaria socialis TaxID=392032 RepID=A0A818GK63_9BILA|nr:unnamed protein product [Rotaria socialis]CAF3469439.1 unnamed protein product [Rotaria socialis]CAF3491385.1 unnamed protein product [Rotaria socialis]CAF3562339.1 unnamed protein product [Rotaria socialis]CAF4260492.1 unnamed protein product [Rotaria socialis]
MQLKWGIVGTGRICQDFCLALLTCDPHEHVIVAASSRDKTQADNFVRDFELGDQVRTYGSQEELFNDANVDIVYIGTIEQVHRDLCIKALTNNKHVLCEKPLAMNEAEVQDIVDTARKTKKFMMEAIWSRFFPIYDNLRDAVKQIGTVTYVECTFCVTGLVSFGIWSLLMAIGCYPVQAALIAFDHEEPVSIVASGHTREHQGEKTDSMATITLLFKNNRMAVLNCLGQDIGAINSLTIHGTEGVISLPTHFWCPTQIVLPNGHHIDHDLPETLKKTNYTHSAGLRYEAMACRDQIMNGKSEHPFMTLENSLQIARIIEQARKQILAAKH